MWDLATIVAQNAAAAIVVGARVARTADNTILGTVVRKRSTSSVLVEWDNGTATHVATDVIKVVEDEKPAPAKRTGYFPRPVIGKISTLHRGKPVRIELTSDGVFVRNEEASVGTPELARIEYRAFLDLVLGQES